MLFDIIETHCTVAHVMQYYYDTTVGILPAVCKVVYIFLQMNKIRTRLDPIAYSIVGLCCGL